MKLSRFIFLLVISVLIFSIAALGLYVFGRTIWHPILVKLNGGVTANDRLRDIIIKKPYLNEVPGGKITLVAFKEENELSVYVDRKIWKTFRILAASGDLGPKFQEGDLQVPEGFYKIDAINPNSAFYLSIRVSYPNDEDRIRSQKQDIRDLGGDIYIHGKSVSIGCLAMGDDVIEDIFYLVVSRGYEKTDVIISPTKKIDSLIGNSKENDLYRLLNEFISQLIRDSSNESLHRTIN